MRPPKGEGTYNVVVIGAGKVGDRYNRTRLTPRAKAVFEWLYRRQRGAWLT